MITLDNIAVEELYQGLGYPELEKFIISENIKTIGELFLKLENVKNINWDLIDKKMTYIFREMENNNGKGKEPIIYHIDEYSNPNLNNQDILNDGSILLLNSPLDNNGITYRSLKYMKMELIKRYLSLTRKNGNNYFIWYANKVGASNVYKVIEAINMYTKQIERQSQLANKEDINLFNYQKDIKEKLTKELIYDIIEYLISDNRDFVWEELTDHKKKLYLSALFCDNKREVILRDNMINMISNYTTLPELESILDEDYQVLNRFKKN